ncbi:MAG: tol-pal system protein YbgF [Pseudomonadota bacterium]
MRATRIAALLVAWMATAAPVYAGLFDDEVARKQIVEQQRRVDALNARNEEMAARLSRLDEALKVQSETVRAQSGNQPLLELANQMQVMREEMRSIRGQLEVMSNTVEANAKRQRDMYVDLDTRLRRFEQSAPTAPGAGAVMPGPGPVATTSSATSVASPNAAPAADEARAYEAAQNQRRIGNYPAAITAFQSFVQQFARSPLAHRAQYWIGDSYFNLRDFKNAIASQQKLIASYPDSASVPDALLNMASAYLELGDQASARKAMDNLVARYPNSEAAEKAKRRLTSMR